MAINTWHLHGNIIFPFTFSILIYIFFLFFSTWKWTLATKLKYSQQHFLQVMIDFCKKFYESLLTSILLTLALFKKKQINNNNLLL